MRRAPPLHLRVFLGSPGDVAQERLAALEILDALPAEPMLRGRVTIEPCAWDRRTAPMEANADPQESVVKYVGRPSDCDLAVIILAGRLGTPLPADRLQPDGRRYRSGTEWELEDARRAHKPVFLYVRRKPEAPRSDHDRNQQRAVSEFLAGLRNPDGSIAAGCNPYDDLAEFEALFRKHVEAFVASRLNTGRRGLLAAAVVALAFAGGSVAWYGATRPQLTVGSVSASRINTVDGQVLLHVAYEVRRATQEQRCFVQVARQDDRAFRRPLLVDDEAQLPPDGHVKNQLVIVPRIALPPGETRWRGWLRVVLKEGRDAAAASDLVQKVVAAASDPVQLEADAGDEATSPR
jgi:hypothetical protein